MDSEINYERFEEDMLDWLNMSDFYVGYLASLISLKCSSFHTIPSCPKYISLQE